MAERIHYSDLEHLLADDNTPDEVLAEYIKPAPLRALPLAPVMTIDDSKVEVPPNRGIIGLSVKSLNERANRRRLAAYQAKIDGGWKGLKLLQAVADDVVRPKRRHPRGLRRFTRRASLRRQP